MCYIRMAKHYQRPFLSFQSKDSHNRIVTGGVNPKYFFKLKAAYTRHAPDDSLLKM